MGVHVAGCHQRVGITDHACARMHVAQLVPRADGDDDVAAHGDRTIAHAPFRSSSIVTTSPPRTSTSTPSRIALSSSPCTIPRGCHTMPDTGPDRVPDGAVDPLLEPGAARRVVRGGARASTSAAHPVAVTLLDTQVVLYRAGDGRVVAAPDRCPHREAPLSIGHDRTTGASSVRTTAGRSATTAAVCAYPPPPSTCRRHRARTCRRSAAPSATGSSGCASAARPSTDPAAFPSSPTSTIRRSAASTPRSTCGTRRRRG